MDEEEWVRIQELYSKSRSLGNALDLESPSSALDSDRLRHCLRSIRGHLKERMSGSRKRLVFAKNQRQFALNAHAVYLHGSQQPGGFVGAHVGVRQKAHADSRTD